MLIRRNNKQNKKQKEKTRKMEMAFKEYLEEPTKRNKRKWYDILREDEVDANKN